MSFPQAPEMPATKPGRRSRRADILAIVAIVSVLALVDAEIVAYGIPGIVAAAHLLDLPMVLGYAVIGMLLILTLWISIYLTREIWRVEHELNAPPEGS